MSMVLSNNGHYPEPGIQVDVQIREGIEKGWLIIEPFDDEAVEPATYDLRVGHIAILSTSTRPIDLRVQELIIVEPFAAAFLQTEEVVTLSPRLVGRVGPRSNIMRSGLFVSTGPQIDPGFSGRLFVALFNLTDRPFSIKHRERFLSVEFHGLSRAPSKTYSGPHQNKTELSPDEINALLSRGGPAFKDIHRDLLEVQVTLKDIALLRDELPQSVQLQRSSAEVISTVAAQLQRAYNTYSTREPWPIVIPIATLDPEPFDLKRDIPATLSPAEDGFIATFFDANIGTSGDTQEEAIANLRDLIIEIFEDLESELPDNLGPEPLRQLSVLRTFLRRR